MNIGMMRLMKFAAASAICFSAEAAKQPNFVFIHLDDLDFDEIGCYDGKGRVLTPNMDRLAAEGMQFHRAYVNSTVCVPSRYSMLTGKYVGYNHLFRDTIPHEKTISYENREQWGKSGAFIDAGRGEKTMAHYLNELGYKTALFGKYHNDRTNMVWPYLHFGSDPRHPQTLDLVKIHYGHTRARIQRQTGFDVVECVYWENKEAFPVEALQFDNSPWITEGAVRFIRENKSRPFLLYYASPLPHGIAVNANWKDGVVLTNMDPSIRDARATPAGMLDEVPSIQPTREEVLVRNEKHGIKTIPSVMTWLDDSIGVLLKTLEEEGLADSTLVIIMSDHQSAGKRNLYEGGCRIPQLARWPGVIQPGSRNNQLTASIDWLPTMIELAGGNPGQHDMLNGVSLVPTLKDPAAKVRDDVLLEVGFARGVVSETYKYIALRFPDGVKDMQENPKAIWDGSDRPGREYYEKIWPHFADDDQLFDIGEDPNEQRNLADDPEHRAVLEKLQQRLTAYLNPMPHTFGEFSE